MTPLDGILAGLGFRQVVLLWPVLTVLHVYEEWPGFPVWARRFASPAYSNREYVVTHVLTVGIAVAGAVVLSLWPGPLLVFAAFALVLGSGVAWNGCFHLGATLWSRAYCPGVVTGVVLYLPFSAWLGHLAVHDGIVTPASLAAAFALALLGHVVEVGHSVFKRW